MKTRDYTLWEGPNKPTYRDKIKEEDNLPFRWSPKWEEEEKQKEKQMEPTLFKSIEDEGDGYEIEQIEGVITKVRDTAKGKTKGRAWSFQNCYMKDDDGEEHSICFMGPDMEQKGILKKRLRITGSLSLAVNEKDGKTYRTINVKDGAEVEIIGSGGEPKPKSSSGGSGKSKDSGAITVKRRVWALLKTIAIVRDGVEAMQGELPVLSPSDMKEIAVSAVIAAQRGEPLPYFGQSTDEPVESFDDAAKETMAHDEREDKGPKKEKVKSWEDYEHPSKKQPLGEFAVTKLKEFAKWALTTDCSEDPKEVKQFQGVLLTMAAEKKWTLYYFLADALTKQGYGEKFRDAAYDAACKEKYDVKANGLDEDQKKEIIESAEEFAALCIEKEGELEEKPAPKSKKGIPD